MGQKVGLDTSVFIYALESHTEFSDTAARLLTRIESGTLLACFSVIGMVELLTGPKILGETITSEQYKYQLSHFPNLNIVGINENIVDLSSSLRACYGIRTPDAIHLATAIDFGALYFVSSDKSLQKIKEIEVKIL